MLEYQIDQVATQAAIRAGYSAGTAHVQGSRLLSNVKVREAIAKAQAKAAGNAEVTIERVLKEYARIAFLNPQDLYDADGRLHIYGSNGESGNWTSAASRKSG